MRNNLSKIVSIFGWCRVLPGTFQNYLWAKPDGQSKKVTRVENLYVLHATCGSSPTMDKDLIHG